MPGTFACQGFRAFSLCLPNYGNVCEPWLGVMDGVLCVKRDGWILEEGILKSSFHASTKE
jgi:hypothetical protein